MKSVSSARRRFLYPVLKNNFLEVKIMNDPAKFALHQSQGLSTVSTDEKKMSPLAQTAPFPEVLSTAPQQSVDITQRILGLYDQKQIPQIEALLNISLPYSITWNEPWVGNRNINLARAAVKMLPEACLFNLLLKTPIERFYDSDWWNVELNGETLASLAAEAALSKKSPQLLDKLLELPDDILKKINWNASVRIIETPTPTSLSILALRLTRKGQPKLLERILSFPAEIFDKINWKEKSFLSVLLEEKQEFKPKFLKQILHPRILLRLDWRMDVLIKTFLELAQLNWSEFDLVLSQLPDDTLRFLREIFSEKSILSDYLNFILQIRSDAKPTSELIQFSKTYSLKSSSCYFGLASTVPDAEKALAYYSKVSVSSYFYTQTEEKLAQLHLQLAESYLKPSPLMEYKTVSMVSTFRKLPEEKNPAQSGPALKHALKWYYYDKEHQTNNEAQFMQLMAQIFKNSQEYPASKIENFLKALLTVEPKTLDLRVDIFIQSLKTDQLVREKIKLGATS
jgi:hypothetical protein